MPDPKELWQNQPTEVPQMTLALIRRRAQELQAKTRLELFTHAAMAVFLTALSGWGITQTTLIAAKIAYALAAIWALTGQYFVQQGMGSATMPGDAGLSSGFDYYRRELERRQSLLNRVVRWTFGPIVLTVSAFILAMVEKAQLRGVSWRTMLPFCTLFAAWMVIALVMHWRRQRAVREEIDELDRLGNS